MIRQATLTDIPSILPLITIIWHDMSHPLLDLVDTQTFYNIMTDLMSHENSKFSYKNALVCDNNGIQGVLYHYDGALENTLNHYLIDYMTQHFPHLDTSTLHVDNETFPNEWYIDSVVVDSHFRGRGVGSSLIKHVINTKKDTHIITLNCEYDNSNAYALYTKLGFKHLSDITFLGHKYRHMIYSV